MLFAKKEPLNSKEYEDLLKRLLEVKHEISALDARFEALQTNYNDLRGKFNRKLNIIKEEEEKDAKSTEAQPLNTFNPFMH